MSKKQTMPFTIVPGGNRPDLGPTKSANLPRRIYAANQQFGSRLSPLTHDNKTGRGYAGRGGSTAARSPFRAPSAAESAGRQADDRLQRRTKPHGTRRSSQLSQPLQQAQAQDLLESAGRARRIKIAEIPSDDDRPVISVPAGRQYLSVSPEADIPPPSKRQRTHSTGTASAAMAQPIHVGSDDEAGSDSFKKPPSLQQTVSWRRQGQDVASAMSLEDMPIADAISSDSDHEPSSFLADKLPATKQPVVKMPPPQPEATKYAVKSSSTVRLRLVSIGYQTKSIMQQANCELVIRDDQFSYEPGAAQPGAVRSIPANQVIKWRHDTRLNFVEIQCSKVQYDFDGTHTVKFYLKDESDNQRMVRFVVEVRNKKPSQLIGLLLSKLDTTLPKQNASCPIELDASPKASRMTDSANKAQKMVQLDASPQAPQTSAYFGNRRGTVELDLFTKETPANRPRRSVRGAVSIVPGSRRDASQPFTDLDAKPTPKPTVSMPSMRETRQRARLKELAQSSDPVLVYPHKAASSVSLYPDDVERLKPGEFLNDSLIDYYLRYNFDHLPEERRKESYLFNTFFYKKLTQKHKGDAVSGHKAVEKWTRKANVDLFSKKYVVIPVNESLHWYLIVIANLDKCVFGEWTETRTQKTYIEEEGPEEPDVTEITDDELDLESQKAVQLPTSTPKADAHPIGSIFDFEDEGKETAREETEPTAPKSSVMSAFTRQLRNEQLNKMSSRDKAAAALADLHIEDIQATPPTRKSKASPKKKKATTPRFLKPGKHLPTDEPVILILDSLRNRHNKVYATIKDYLVAEAETRLGKHLNAEQFHSCLAAVPGQDNFSDCGLFLIHYAEKMLSQPDAVLNDLLPRISYRSEASLKQAEAARDTLWEISKMATRRMDMVDEILGRSESWQTLQAAEQQAQAEVDQGQVKPAQEGAEASSLMETTAPARDGAVPDSPIHSQENVSEAVPPSSAAPDVKEAMSFLLEGSVLDETIPATQSPKPSHVAPYTSPLSSPPPTAEPSMLPPISPCASDAGKDKGMMVRSHEVTRLLDSLVHPPPLPSDLSEDPINMLHS